MRLVDLTGKRIGGLQVLRRAPNRPGYTMPRWHCRCNCGKLIVRWSSTLSGGYYSNCGCMHGFKLLKHGMTHTRVHFTWLYLKRRKAPICKEWKEFYPFYLWALDNGYEDDLFLMIKNKELEFSPENCFWAKYRSTVKSKLIQFDGELLTMAELARRIGVSRQAIDQRIQHGWSDDELIIGRQKTHNEMLHSRRTNRAKSIRFRN